MARNVALAGALALTGLLAFLTVSVAIEDGIDLLVIVSFLVLALIGVGILGALTAPGDDE
jgi:hypothetical protein